MTDIRLDALVFDFDGTMVDTETPALESVMRIWREHDAELSTGTVDRLAAK